MWPVGHPALSVESPLFSPVADFPLTINARMGVSDEKLVLKMWHVQDKFYKSITHFSSSAEVVASGSSRLGNLAYIQ